MMSWWIQWSEVKKELQFLPHFKTFWLDVVKWVLQRKLAFCKTATKALLKPSFELVALVTLRVPPILTVALLNFYSSKQRTSPSVAVVSSSSSTSSLGFPGGSLGFTEQAGAVLLCYCRPLRPYLDLVLRELNFASAWCNVGSVTSGCNTLLYFLY